MDKTQIITLILGSAAIGALVSSITTLIAQILERNAKKKELLFTKAVELAQADTQQTMEILKQSKRPVLIEPTIMLVEKYLTSLTQLHKTGSLPAEVKTGYEKSKQEEIERYINRK